MCRPAYRPLRPVQVHLGPDGARAQSRGRGPDGRGGEPGARLHPPERRVRPDDGPPQQLVHQRHTQHARLHPEQHADAPQGDPPRQRARLRHQDHRDRPVLPQREAALSRPGERIFSLE